MNAGIRVIVVAFLVLQPTPCRAEDRPGEVPTWLREGSHLQLGLSDGEPRTTKVWYLRDNDSTIFVRSNPDDDRSALEIRTDQITRFDVSQEMSTHVVRGFFVGWFVTGLATTLALVSSDEVDPDETLEAVAVGFGIYGPLGGLLGSIVGDRFQKDRWVTVWERNGRPGPGAGE